MSFRFFTPSREWPAAVIESLSHIVNSSQREPLDEPVFRFGPPDRGRLPFWVEIGGHATLLCELSDCYPFLRLLRDWLERCLSFDCFGEGQPGFVKLDSVAGPCSFIMVHAGIDKAGYVDASLFAVIRPGECHPCAYCFCSTRQAVGAIYGALMDALHSYRDLFNDSSVWYDPGAFSLRDPRRTSDRMEDEFRSGAIETLADFSSGGRR